MNEIIFGLKIDKDLNYLRQAEETLALRSDQIIKAGEFLKGDDAQIVDFDTPITARYLCVESLSSHGNDPHAAIAELHLLHADGRWLDRDGWKVIYADSEEIIAEPSSAANVLDNQPVTFWHTNYSNAEMQSKHPYHLVIDLGQTVSFQQLRYLPRNGPNPGKIREYKIYASPSKFDGLK